MKILLDHIKDTPLTIHINEPVVSFPLLSDMQNSEICTITGDIQGDMIATREFDTIRISGRMTAPLALSCSRCLAEFTSFVDTSFTIFFRKEEPHKVLSGDELELAEMDLLSSTYSGTEIDLTHEIEEQIAMEIPLKPLCSESCKGLCHECGTDLNKYVCSCDDQSVSMAFSSLKDFKILSK